MDNLVADFIKKRMEDEEALKDARESASGNRLFANLGKAFSQIGSGIAGATVQPDTSIFDNLNKTADIPVTELLAQQKARREDDSVLGGLRKEEKTLADEAELKDPNSPRAMVYKKILGRMNPDYQEDLKPLPVMDAKEVGSLLSEEKKNKRLAESEALDKRYKESLINNRTTGKDESSISQLRREATSGELGKFYANSKTAERALKAVNDFSKDPSGYKDYGTLMLALKTLQGDQSVVREAEIKQGVNAASLADQAANYIQMARKGTKLQPGQRKQIAEAIGILASTAKDQYVDASRKIYDQASRRSLPLNEIFDSPGDYQAVPREVKTVVNKRLKDPKEQARLEELLKKQAQGTLK